MTTITTQIWHEKVRSDVQEYFKNSQIPYYAIEDPTERGKEYIKDGKTYAKDDNDWVWKFDSPTGSPCPEVTESDSKNSFLDANKPYELTRKTEVGAENDDQNCHYIEPYYLMNDTNHFAMNLPKINSDINSLWKKYHEEITESTHNEYRNYIPACLKKHLTHNKMEFYCLTDEGDVEDLSKSAEDFEKIYAQAVTEFAGKGPYKAILEGGKILISNRETQLVGDHVTEVHDANKFDNPTEKRHAQSQDFNKEPVE